MDYIVFDPRTRTVWAPAGNTAAVDVVDITTRRIAQVTGFATREVERNGQKRTVGPSAAALGEPGTVYIVNRGDSSVCAVRRGQARDRDLRQARLEPRRHRLRRPSHEVWVTTPRDNSIRVLDAVTLARRPGSHSRRAEGFAVDATRNRFYTNLEDKDVTLAIDLTSRATSRPGSRAAARTGRRGLRIARARGLPDRRVAPPRSRCSTPATTAHPRQHRHRRRRRRYRLHPASHLVTPAPAAPAS